MPFDSSSKEPFKISRSKIDLFLECPRCFYLDARLGIKRPSMPPFTLNSAVDHLLKKEFDLHRAEKEAHPLMKKYKINAVPFQHPDLEKWRHNFTGIRFVHQPTNLLVFGAVDDVWIDAQNELNIVDYKATAKDEVVDKLADTRWHDQYRRQMEVYQWLFRQNGFKVSAIGYFVYVNAYKDRKAFDGKLEFDVRIISYKGDESWVEETLAAAKKCLLSETIPQIGELCEYCPYREAAGSAFREKVLAGGNDDKIKVKKQIKNNNETKPQTLF